MRVDYSERYRELYERHWWWRARERLILGTLRAHRPLQGWKRILDVGCGDGLFFDQLAQFGEVEGVEPAEAVVSRTGPHRARIHIGTFDQSFQPAQRYSLVLFLDVLEHLPDPAMALRHALNLLEPGGTILVTVPAFNLLWTNHDTINGHLVRFTKSSFRHLAQEAGLELEMQRYFFQWLVPVKLATRFAERAFRLPPKLPAVPALWINRTLHRISCLEQKTWGAGLLPFGSSLMAVGHRATRQSG